MFLRLILFSVFALVAINACSSIKPEEVNSAEGIEEFIMTKFGENYYQRIPNREGSKVLYIRTSKNGKTIDFNAPLEFIVSDLKNNKIICHIKLPNGAVTWKDNNILMITLSEGNPSSGENSPLVFTYYDTKLKDYIEIAGEEK